MPTACQASCYILAILQELTMPYNDAGPTLTCGQVLKKEHFPLTTYSRGILQISERNKNIQDQVVSVLSIPCRLYDWFLQKFGTLQKMSSLQVCSVLPFCRRCLGFGSITFATCYLFGVLVDNICLALVTCCCRCTHCLFPPTLQVHHISQLGSQAQAQVPTQAQAQAQVP